MTKPVELFFDTTALVDIYRGQTIVKKYFDAIQAGDVFPYISVITEAELWRGLRAEELERHELILSLFTTLSVESDAARLAGSWMQHYEQTGLGWMDALIAASAKLVELPVLTRDKKLANVLAAETEFKLYGVT